MVAVEVTTVRNEIDEVGVEVEMGQGGNHDSYGDKKENQQGDGTFDTGNPTEDETAKTTTGTPFRREYKGGWYHVYEYSRQSYEASSLVTTILFSHVEK